MELIDMEGDTIPFPLFESADPVHSDGNITLKQATLETANNIIGGLVRFLTGMPGFRIVLLLDKGFQVHRFNPANKTMNDVIQDINN